MHYGSSGKKKYTEHNGDIIWQLVEPWRGGSVLVSRPEGRGFDPRLCCLFTVKPPLFVGRIN